MKRSIYCCGRTADELRELQRTADALAREGPSHDLILAVGEGDVLHVIELDSRTAGHLAAMRESVRRDMCAAIADGWTKEAVPLSARPDPQDVH